MKKLVLMITVLFACSLAIPLQAQKTQKELEKEVKSKSLKKARKEAKQFKKDGFYVAPGALPMDKQLEDAWMKEMETDENGYDKYIVATGQSVGETQTAAKIQATETAKLELAGMITTNIAALIENSIANQQLNAEEAASVTKTVAASKNIIAQELGRVLPLFEVYRNIGQNIEADIRLAYNSDVAMDLAKKVIRQKLEEETTILHEKLEQLMDF
jgi:hypothetical protein